MKGGTMKHFVFFVLMVFALCSCVQGIHNAASTGDMQGVERLVEKGQIEKKDQYGGTPLITAVYYNQTGVVKYLLDKGANINAQKKRDGATALIYASMYNYPAMAKLLIDRGASVNVKDSKGHTALYYAKLYKFNDVTAILVENGGESE